MDIFGIYLVFFGFSTVVGVPLLSSFQVTQIKGSTVADWVSGLPVIMGSAILIFIAVSLIAYTIMKPLRQAIRESEIKELSQEEKLKANKILQRLKLVTVISLIIGYPIGNGATIIIKTLAGKCSYSTSDLIVIMILILLYAVIAVDYSVSCFSVAAREQLIKLKIHSTDGIKTKAYSATVMRILTAIILICAWHIFGSGYSALRHGWPMNVFIKKVLISYVYAFSFTCPLFIYS